MARSSKFENDLRTLEALRRAADVRGDDPLLLRVLASTNGMLIAKAVQIAREHELRALAEPMSAALASLLAEDYKADPGCGAKLALLEALGEWDVRDEAVLLRGVRHVQLEPVWGGSQDTAGQLRGRCLHELLRARHPEAPYEVVRLLHDPSVQAREAAAEAAGMLPGLAAEVLLRHKIMAGDEDARVLFTCFEQLAEVAPADSMDFFAQYLEGGDPLRFEGAALAAAASHQPEAFPLLRKAWKRRDLEVAQRVSLLNAMALVRSEESFAFMLDLIGNDQTRMARAAVKALTIWQGDEDHETRIIQALERRDETAVSEVWNEGARDG